MRLARFAIAAFVSLAPGVAFAQIVHKGDTIDIRQLWRDSRVGQKVDSVFDRRDRRAQTKYDTAYIAKPPQHLTVKIRGNVSGSEFFAKSETDGVEHKTILNADMRGTVGASATYRGVTLGFALNPAKLAGKNKDYEFNLNAYGNRVGAEVVYLAANTYRGRTEYGGESHEIGTGVLSLKMFTASAYYAFSHRKFSFPAAFTQSQQQRRSCGTWMLGASLLAGTMKTAKGIIDDNAANKLTLFHVAVGGGYAYNFVTRHNWLIHISAMPQIVVLENNKMVVGSERQRTPFRFPNLENVGRLAFVHFHNNRFYGLSAVVNVWNLGDYDTLHVENVKWRARLFYGFRF